MSITLKIQLLHLKSDTRESSKGLAALSRSCTDARTWDLLYPKQMECFCSCADAHTWDQLIFIFPLKISFITAQTETVQTLTKVCWKEPTLQASREKAPIIRCNFKVNTTPFGYNNRSENVMQVKLPHETHTHTRKTIFKVSTHTIK